MKLISTKNLIGSLCGAAMLTAAMTSCAPKQNTLTEEEIADGWELLFDGKSLDQWKDFNGDSLTQPWHVVDGCIQANGDGSDLSGYIVTKKQYENFILDWEWKLSHGGNSGMLYHVVEDPYFKVPYVTGPEYQLIDEEGWEEDNAPTKLEEWQRLGVDYAMHLPDKGRHAGQSAGVSGTPRASSSTTDTSSTGSTARRSSNSRPGPTTGSPASTAASGRPLPSTVWHARA